MTIRRELFVQGRTEMIRFYHPESESSPVYLLRPLIAVVVISATFVLTPNVASSSGAPLTGSLFVDFNRNGAYDADEAVPASSSYFPQSEITIVAHDVNGDTATGEVSRGEPPTYSIDVSSLEGTEFVVTYSLAEADLNAGHTETFPGTDQLGATRVLTSGDVSHFGTIPPSECPRSGQGADGQANVEGGKVWTTCFSNGDRSEGRQDTGLLGFNNADGAGVIETLAERDDFGSIWGLA